LSRAAAVARRNLGEHPDMGGIIEDYCAILRSQGRGSEADDLRVEVRRARVVFGLVRNVQNPF